MGKWSTRMIILVLFCTILSILSCVNPAAAVSLECSIENTDQSIENINPGESNSITMQEEMLSYINAARIENGLPALYLNPVLSEGAYLKDTDMAFNNYFSHTSPTYGSPLDMMANLGISHSIMGENLSKNFSVLGAFNSLMNSPPHKANILRSEFTNIGLGFYQATDFLYVTQWFTG